MDAVLIELTQGHVAIIDATDLPLLGSRKWRAVRDGAMWYAKAHTPDGSTEFMHRRLLCAPAGMQVDHLNGWGLDNRRSNLRLVVNGDNQSNRSAFGSSRFIGVSRCGAKWKATVVRGGKRLLARVFDTEEEAAAARDQCVITHGIVSKLNF